ncbi:hypothetical protein D3C81_1689370 [compost metagenome]
MVCIRLNRAFALITAGGTYRLIGNFNSVYRLGRFGRMLNVYSPGFAPFIHSRGIQVSPGIDDKSRKVLQLTGCQINGKAFSHRTQINDHRLS